MESAAQGEENEARASAEAEAPRENQRSGRPELMSKRPILIIKTTVLNIEKQSHLKHKTADIIL